MPIDGLELESGLENRLRGLIITHQTPGNEAAQPSAGTNGDLARPEDSFKQWNRVQWSEQFLPPQGSLDSHRGTHPRKSSKRRLNQAQRRQMSAEVSNSMPMASQRNPDHGLHEPDLQHSRSASHPLRGERQLSEYWLERNTQSTPWYNNSSLPRLAESHTDVPHHLNWHSGHSVVHHTSQYFPTTPLHSDRQQSTSPDDIVNEATLLDKLCHEVVSEYEIDRHEIAQKENFRQRIEVICQQVIADHECRNDVLSGFPESSVELKCFGSMSSGFATKSSDMDLGLFSPHSKIQPDSASSPIPRLVEKGLLQAGFGARLLSRTRVPIIKLCESPPEDLRRALLAERAKWESGANSDVAEAPENQSQELNSQPDDINDVKGVGVVAEFPAYTEFQPKAYRAHGGVERAELKQKARSSLTAYYELAKRVLRRAGGRDITFANHREFGSSDWAILNRVCRAFLQGLYDNLLRQRLESRSSLSLENLATGSFNRSLSGVFTQILGERLLLDWEQFLAKDAFHDSTGRIDRAIRSWVEVQNKSQYGIDALAYNKELRSAYERLKSQPEIQLMQLAQDSKETATEYYSRAYNLIHKSGLPDLNTSNSTRQQYVLAYISGIHDESIRDSLALESTNIAFEELGQKHKCLQLAREFERAIDHQLYGQHLTKDISDYVRVLRMPLVKVDTSENRAAFRIPVTKETLPLLSRIRLLSGPRKLEINRLQNKSNDPLAFPDSDVGVQCDINFSAQLALQNTKLLRCYSLTDPRVRPMVLFIKKWAKVRGINSAYRGTLSSYGYVLMVLHFLVNISKPFVCPNLQHLAPSASENGELTRHPDDARFCGYNVQFWQDELEINRLAANGQLTYNTETIGHLLRGFFEYFANSGLMSHGLGQGFDWGRDVLSLRTHGGLLTKQEKGWTGAKTVIQGHNATRSRVLRQSGKTGPIKKVKLRYLFAIEDPFELDHNVARTVTYSGNMAIREEFRRAWRIIQTSGSGWSEDLLTDVTRKKDDPDSFEQLLEEIHGPKELWSQCFE